MHGFQWSVLFYVWPVLGKLSVAVFMRIQVLLVFLLVASQVVASPVEADDGAIE